MNILISLSTRPESTFEPSSCPYCVQPHFGIVYTPLEHDLTTRRRSFSHDDPLVVTSDDIRPDWEEKKKQMEMERALEEQRIALAHARRRQMEVLK